MSVNIKLSVAATYHPKTAFPQFLHQTKPMSWELQKRVNTSVTRWALGNLDWGKLSGCEMLLSPFRLKPVKVVRKFIKYGDGSMS
jgi:hypothetical protein